MRRRQYQQQTFEDALMDAALDMCVTGDLSDAEMKSWFDFFSISWKLSGFVTKRDVKTSIIRRLENKYFFGLMPVKIPGGINVMPLDHTYKPKEASRLAKSKYACMEEI